jgi:hypothetical protein
MECGYEVEMETEFDVDTFQGYLPCNYKGQLGGFEYDADPLTDNDREALALPDDYDFVVSILCGSSPREFIPALIATAVLCSQTGGLFFDPRSGNRVPAVSALEMLKDRLAESDQPEA